MAQAPGHLAQRHRPPAGAVDDHELLLDTHPAHHRRPSGAAGFTAPGTKTPSGEES
ncbi:hypothetical protein [Arthrobacter pityocampae]|uniref:hypothetical protein n=1 Tax=Arthrobacter pityocampae TaxID=547334 RepID=UPI00142D48F4|nr:hypothetical protein [Arthrobacter pityocampae]